MTQILVDNNKSEARVFLDEEVNSNDLTNVEHEETDRDMENSTSEEVNSSDEETETYSKSYEGVIPPWLSKLGQHRILSRQEEREIGKRIKEGDEDACNLLVTHNFRLVFSVALKYKELGVPLEDLVQEGSVGLMKAAKKFDYTKGFKFSTYAIWWVRQAIMRLLDNMARTIRLPSYLIDKSYLLDDVHGHLQKKLNRDPSFEEIANELEIDTDQVVAITTLKKSTVSLDKGLNSTDDVTISLIDTVEDPYADPEQTYISDMVDKDLVDNLLDKLSDKQSEVLRRRYGIGKEGNVETLRELGDMFDLTRERIRQIEVDALEKLRNVYDENGESRLAVNINI